MRRTVALALLLVAIGRPALPQATGLTGTVTDSTSGAPVPGARLRVLLADGRSASWDVTDARGRYRLGNLAAGTYTLEVLRVGFRPLIVPDVTAPGQLDLALAGLPVPLSPVVVTVARAAENPLDAPSAVSVVERPDIATVSVPTPVDHLARTAAVDVASKGIAQRTYSVRGFLGAASDALLVLTDYRVSAVPSLGFNIPYLLQTPDEDIERIELQRGPGAALYGPGSDRGVLHIITRSAFEPGGSISLAAGTRDFAQLTARYAVTAGPHFGLKVSGGWLRGRDWPLVDSAEVRPREKVFERAGGEARLEWRAGPATEITVGGGLTRALRAVDFIPSGSYQLKGWDLGFAQVRARHGDLIANVYYNWNDAGRTYSLRSGDTLVDRSRQLATQVQYRSTLGRTQLVYGVDVRWTDPRTAGTIDGTFESRDLVRETGAFATATATLRPALDLVGALRVDRHSRLAGTAVSPRVGIVIRTRPTHALRLTYNRAFTTPSTATLFADLAVDRLPDDLPFAIRAEGIPRGGYSFRRDCGGLCMQSPFSLSPQWLPADGTTQWDAVVAIMRRQGVDISGIPAPTSAQVGSVLGLLNTETGSFDAVAPSSVSDIGPNRRELIDAYEIGYKALLGGGVRVETAIWMNRIDDVLGTLTPVTPNVFLNGGDLALYLAGVGMPAQQAQQLAAGIAQIPLGTISPQQAPSPTDILLVSRQGGAYTLWGADIEAEVRLSGEWSAGGSFSWVSRDSVTRVAPVTDFALGVPRRQATLHLGWQNERLGRSADLRMKTVSAFHVTSGIYRGLVDAYTTLDAGAATRLPFGGDLRLSVTVQNLLDDRHREYVGAPAIGRLALVRLQAGL